MKRSIRKRNTNIMLACMVEPTGIVKYMVKNGEGIAKSTYDNLIRKYRQSNKELSDQLFWNSDINSYYILSRKYGRSWRLHKNEHSAYVNRTLS